MMIRSIAARRDAMNSKEEGDEFARFANGHQKQNPINEYRQDERFIHA